MTSRLPTLVAAVLALVASAWFAQPEPGCAALAATPAESEESEAEGPELLGPLARGEIEAAVPDWVEAEMEAQPDLEAAILLESAFDGAFPTPLQMAQRPPRIVGGRLGRARSGEKQG